MNFHSGSLDSIKFAMRILAISGSLRAKSPNTAVLIAAAQLAPREMHIVSYTGLSTLPHFNPDLDTDEPPENVRALRREIGSCDGMLISSPEYARGVAGAMKNALDWLAAAWSFQTNLSRSSMRRRALPRGCGIASDIDDDVGAAGGRGFDHPAVARARPRRGPDLKG